MDETTTAPEPPLTRDAAPCGRWNEFGEAENLEAAAADSLEWLKAWQYNHKAGRAPLSAEDDYRLNGAIAALRKFLSSPQAEAQVLEEAS